MKRQGLRVRTRLKAGKSKGGLALTRQYNTCYKTCYPKVLDDINLTFDACLDACLGTNSGKKTGAGGALDSAIRITF